MKFGGEGYKVSGGLHGVGASVVNALSTYCKVEVHQDGARYMQEYERGKKNAAVKKVGTSKARGTVVTFQPDPEIFKEGIYFEWEKIVDRLKQQAYLVKGLRITILDAREFVGKIDVDKAFYLKDFALDVPSMTFYFEGGLTSFIRSNTAAQKSIHKNIFYVEKATEKGEAVEVALQYVDDISPRIMPFANNIYTP